MKKRLFCLLLCLLMVLPMIFAFTSCSAEEEEEEETTTTTSSSGIKAVTITLYGITGDSTTDEAIQLVQDEINQTTESAFNTHIVLRLYQEDEYYDMIEEKFTLMEAQRAQEEKEAEARKAAQKAAKAAGFTTAAATTALIETTTEEVTDETVLNEYGLETILYPDVEKNQLDIFLITDAGKYQDYAQRELLYALDEELSGNSKILRNYIYPTFLNAVKVGGKTYAIPNNHAVGEYQYLLLNRELMDKYYYDPDTINTIADISDFIETVVRYEQDYIPMINEAEPYIFTPFGEDSVVGSYAPKATAEGTKATPKNVFGVRQYKQVKALMMEYNALGYIDYEASVDESQFAAAIIKGNYAVTEQYEDEYYVIPYKYPTFTNEEVFGGMFAIGAYAKNSARCMEVIRALTVDENLRNVFQYGVEGVHYEKVDEEDETNKMVRVISDEYNMNILHTGNMFKLWPSESMSEAMLAMYANDWELAKKQNLDSVISPYLGFTISETPPEEEETAASDEDEEESGPSIEYMPIPEVIAGLKALSEEYLARVNSFEEYTDEEGTLITASDYIDILAAEVDESEFVIEALDSSNPNSIISQYSTWYDANYGTE